MDRERWIARDSSVTASDWHGLVHRDFSICIAARLGDGCDRLRERGYGIAVCFEGFDSRSARRV